MRSLLIVILVAGTADASPYDVGWGSMQFGLGGPPTLRGELADRTRPAECGDGHCMLAGRVVFGGGIRRWGFELALSSGPIEDTYSMDYRDRDRAAFMWGPHVRYTLLRRYGFDLSVRGGIEHGSLSGNSTETRGANCDGPCPTMTYEPPEYSMWAVSAGIGLMWRVRFDGGFFGIQADLDATAATADYPDHQVSGVITTQTFGITMGSMFDL